MSNLREEFEKLPEINRVLSNHAHSFEDGYYRFKGNVNNTRLVYAMGFVNGSWCAFQEQQKKIDDILNLVCKLQYSSGDRIFKEVKELLK